MKNELKNLIQERISSKKVSQNELAKELGVSNGTISNILNDHWERLNESMITKLLSQLLQLLSILIVTLSRPFVAFSFFCCCCCCFL